MWNKYLGQFDINNKSIKENYDFSDEYDEYYILDNYDDSWVWCEPSSISQKDSDRSIPHLLQSLKSHSFLTRKDAAFFLGEIGSEEIVPDLIISLKDSDSFVCGTATEALIKIGKQSTLVNLFEILKNPTFIHANNGSVFYYAYSVITAIQNKLKYYQPLSSIMTTSKIYISYAWQGESEIIAQQIEKTLKEKGLTIIRDKNSGLPYKGLITEFMDLLGQAECIILIISDKYLKSKSCMYELLEIYKNGNFTDRIFPILIEAEVQINIPSNRLNYINYWKQKHQDLNDTIKTATDLTYINSVMTELTLYDEIYRNFDTLIEKLNNMNSLTACIHIESGFEELFNAIEKKLDSDQSLE
jgi:hypothetical protein